MRKHRSPRQCGCCKIRQFKLSFNHHINLKNWLGPVEIKINEIKKYNPPKKLNKY